MHRRLFLSPAVLVFALAGASCSVGAEVTDQPAAVSVPTSPPSPTAENSAGSEFVPGPYEERPLDPMAGGWHYLDAPPFGAVEPGSDPERDMLWVNCREGDGYACDELNVQSRSDSTYGRFAQTCGGRTADIGCNELLGTERHPGFIADYNADFDLRLNRLNGFQLEHVPGPDSPPPGSDGFKDELWVRCGQGRDATACKELTARPAYVATIYDAFGQSCGGRRVFRSQPCPVFVLDPADRILSGTPPLGTFDEQADDLWVACDENPLNCRSLLQHRSNLDEAVYGEGLDQQWQPYMMFALSCGGEFDRPLIEFTCEESYLDWPVVDHVDSLPLPPKG